MKIIWENIEEYNGVKLVGYQVNNIGQIKSVDRYVNYKNIGKAFKKGQLLKLTLTKDGYYHTTIRNGANIQVTLNVARLVAYHFLPNPDNLPCINHKDENKTNNIVWINDDGSIDYNKTNLEWCSVAYNNSYGTRTERVREKMNGRKFSEEHRKNLSLGRKGMVLSEKHRKNLSEALKGRYNEKNCKVVLQFDLKGNFIREWPSTMEIHRQLGYDSGCIQKCCNNKYKQSYGYKWKYKDVA